MSLVAASVFSLPLLHPYGVLECAFREMQGAVRTLYFPARKLR